MSLGVYNASAAQRVIVNQIDKVVPVYYRMDYTGTSPNYTRIEEDHRVCTFTEIKSLAKRQIIAVMCLDGEQSEFSGADKVVIAPTDEDVGRMLNDLAEVWGAVQARGTGWCAPCCAQPPVSHD